MMLKLSPMPSTKLRVPFNIGPGSYPANIGGHGVFLGHRPSLSTMTAPNGSSLTGQPSVPVEFLEVCREYQRGQCTRTESECKFAHPPPNVDVQNGKVTACYDSIKNRCNPETRPNCKYLHPPQHLKDQLLINGKNSLAIKNIVFNHILPGVATGGAPQNTMLNHPATALLGANPALMQGGSMGMPYQYITAQTSPQQAALYPQIMNAADAQALAYSGMFQAMPTSNGAGSPALMVQAAHAHQHAQQANKARNDRMEVCGDFILEKCSSTECSKAHPTPNTKREPETVDFKQNAAAFQQVVVCMEYVKKASCKWSDSCKYYHPPAHQLAAIRQKGAAIRSESFEGASSSSSSIEVPTLPATVATPMLPMPYSSNANYAVTSTGHLYQTSPTQSASGLIGGGLYPMGLTVSTANILASQQYQQQLQQQQQQQAYTTQLAALAVHAQYSAGGNGGSGGLLSATGPYASQQPAIASASDYQLAAREYQRKQQQQQQQIGASMLMVNSSESMANQAVAVQASQLMHHAAGKKRPLEQDSASFLAASNQYAAVAQANAAVAAASDPTSAYLLAAMQNSIKRPAMDKSGTPVFQPGLTQGMIGAPAVSLAGYPYQLHASALHNPFMAAPQQMFSTTGSGIATMGQILGTSPTAGLGSMMAFGGQPAGPAPGPNNVGCVAYFDESGQLLDSLPVCRDFKQGHCERLSCRYVHLTEDYVDVNDGKVTVCRDFAKGKCTRIQCKYYHVPVLPGTFLLNRLFTNNPQPAAATPAGQMAFVNAAAMAPHNYGTASLMAPAFGGLAATSMFSLDQGQFYGQQQHQQNALQSQQAAMWLAQQQLLTGAGLGSMPSVAGSSSE